MADVTAQGDFTDDWFLCSQQAHETKVPDSRLQRAQGSARVVVYGAEGGTRVIDVVERFPLRVMFPGSAVGTLQEAVLVNTAGGLAGGDRLEFHATALGNASIALTSQAAEKVYRALNEPACVTTKLSVGAAAKVAWLPQETILFNRGRLRRETQIDISSGAELLFVEWLVLGRAAHGEAMRGGYVADSWCVKKDGRLIWADRFRVADEMFSQLHRTALLSNHKAVATLLHFGPSLNSRLEFLRGIAASLQCRCYATIVSGLIVARLAAAFGYELRLALRSLVEQFGSELGNGPFGVPKMWSC